MTNEQWRPVPVSARHEVSNLGRLRTIDGRVLTRKAGCRMYNLSLGSGRDNWVSVNLSRLLDEVWPFHWLRDLDDDESVVPYESRRDYYLSSKGRLYKVGYGWCKVGKVRGFKYPRLTIDRQPVMIHTALGRHFIPNPDNLPFVLHNDDNPLNYSLTNLRWGDNVMNWADALANGVRRRKSYTFMWEGVQIHTSNLKQWCEDNGYSYNGIFHRLRRQGVV